MIEERICDTVEVIGFCNNLDENCQPYHPWRTTGTIYIDQETGRFFGFMKDVYGQTAVYGIIREGVVYFVKPYNEGYHYLLKDQELFTKINPQDGIFKGNWNRMLNNEHDTFRNLPVSGQATFVFSHLDSNTMMLDTDGEVIDWDTVEQSFEKHSQEVDEMWG